MYELVLWPECQIYMALIGFKENACLADSDEFVDKYGTAYFINVEWKKQADEHLDSKCHFEDIV